MFREWWRGLDVVVRDLVGAVGLLGLALLPGMAGMGADVPEYVRHRPMDWFGWALVVAVSVPLGFRRRWPVATVLVTGVAFVLYEAVGYSLSAATLGFPFALYAAGAHQTRRRRELVWALVAAYPIFVAVLEVLGSTQTPLQYVIFLGTLAAFWLVGRWMRTQRAVAEQQRRDSMALAVATERQSIARELHDVVTHHVTAMVLQADAAGLMVTAAPDQAKDAVKAVSGTGRRALVELRHLLQVLDDGKDDDGKDHADRTPGTERIEDLIDRTRALGQPVSLTEEGAPRPDGGVGLTVYRVVQESLTNAVKYAHGKPTAIRIANVDGTVAVEVTTVGAAAMAGGAVRTGRGLAGMRDRVGLFGGEFEAGPTGAGEFVVKASIPVGAGVSVGAGIPVRAGA